MAKTLTYDEQNRLVPLLKKIDEKLTALEEKFDKLERAYKKEVC